MALRQRRAVDARLLPGPKAMATAITAIRSHQPASHMYEVMTEVANYAGLRPSGRHAAAAGAGPGRTGVGRIHVPEADIGWARALNVGWRPPAAPDADLRLSPRRGDHVAARCVPLGEVARRLGHSVETLVSTYVGALDGTWAFSGRCGIRTHGDPEATTAFEAAPFVRSGNLPGLQATSETWRLRRGSMPSHHDRARSRARGVARGVGLPGLGEAAHRLLEHRRFGGVGEPEMALVLAGG
jgi:hypothetical protein